MLIGVNVLYCPAQSGAASDMRHVINKSTLACLCHLRLHAFAGTTWLERVAAHLAKSVSGRSCENSISLSALAFLTTADVIIHLNRQCCIENISQKKVLHFAHGVDDALLSRKDSGCL